MLYNTSKKYYICDTMNLLTYIFRHFSLSCVMAGALALASVKASASANSVEGPGDSYDRMSNKIEKTSFKLGASFMKKTSLSLDGAFKNSGNVNSDFKFTSENSNVSTLNFKSVVTYKKGNVTYILPYAVQIQQPSNLNLGFHNLQITLPLRKN